jgi:NAD(P)-dependent dehydrogenase (short-subunit alcohol dehydrogenase family)
MMTEARTVCVLGASSDIGIAICHRYLAAGYRIVAHHRRDRDAFDAVRDHAMTTPIRLDFGDSAGLEAAVAANQEVLARCDVLVNAAAMWEHVPFTEASVDQVMKAFSVNLLPGLIFMQAMAPKMCERRWGRIVHLGSIGVAFGGGSSSFAYALSKHAMEFIPSDHKAWAGANVLVNVLRCGVTNTRIHSADPDKDMVKRVSLIPMGRMARPEEVAETVFFLGSEANTLITGQTIVAAGGE